MIHSTKYFNRLFRSIKENTMETITNSLKSNVAKLDAQKIKLILVLVTLALFVLGAGAPGTPGGFGG
jgi:hypothetical protein